MVTEIHKTTASFRFANRLMILSVLGALISAYLLYHHVKINSGFQTEPSFCAISPSFDCDKVARSKYSTVFGTPVASFGLIYYIIFASIVAFMTPRRGVQHQQFFSVTLVWALLSIPPTGSLAALSSARLDTFCLLCIMLYVINAALVVLTLVMPGHLARVGWRIVGGCRLILGFLLQTFRMTPLGHWARLAIVSVIVFSIAVFKTPEMLMASVFNELISARAPSDQAQRLVDIWERSVSRDLELNLSGPAEERDYFYGQADAPITIVEFSDFECPYCRKAAPILKKIVDESNGKAKLIFRNYPLDHSCNSMITYEKHKYACAAARAVRCAGVVQGSDGFWKMHDELFRYPGIDGPIIDIAERAGLNRDAMNSCLENPQTADRVIKDVNLGNRLGLTGTPAVYINGKSVENFNEGAIRTIVNKLSR